MKTLVTDVRKEFKESSVLGEGRFFDETEIEKEYKDRPEQKTGIYQNALKCWHPDRQCDVWRIRTFVTSDLEKSLQERTLERHDGGVKTCKQNEGRKS